MTMTSGSMTALHLHILVGWYPFQFLKFDEVSLMIHTLFVVFIYVWMTFKRPWMRDFINWEESMRCTFHEVFENSIWQADLYVFNDTQVHILILGLGISFHCLILCQEPLGTGGTLELCSVLFSCAKLLAVDQKTIAVFGWINTSEGYFCNMNESVQSGIIWTL